MSSLLLPDNAVWAPAYHTKPLSSTTRGDDIVDFAELLMTASRGFKAGEALQFTQWQSWLMKALLEENDKGNLRYRRAIIGLPRKNGKSLLGTALALEHLMYGPEGAQIYSAAADRQQARIVFGEARSQVLNNPILEKHIKVYRDALENPRTGGIYRALSSDGNRAHGLGPSLAILDELHAWPSSASNSKGDELYDALVSGSADRPESLVVGITTAGGNTDTLLGRLYEHGKKIAAGEVEDSQFGFFWWEAPQDADPRDPQVWKAANPNLAEGLLAMDDFEASIKEAEAKSFSSFQRFRLNQWVRLAGEDFINPAFWAEAESDKTIPDGAEICIGFDGSVSGDATGLVAIDVNTGIIKVLNVWEPDLSDPDWNVDRTEVNMAVEKAFNTYNVKMLWGDPSFFETDMAEWANRWRNRVERIPPQNHRIVPLAQQFLSDIYSKEIKHDGNATMTRHALNAVATEVGSFRKEKKGSPRKIDLLMCAVLANGARNVYKNKPQNQRRSRVL
jgi:phage terminase large subunit-like protein